MCPADSKPDDDPLAQLARIIHDQMTIEPRRMNVAIELAKQHLTDIRGALVKEGLRAEGDEDEASDGSETR